MHELIMCTCNCTEQSHTYEHIQHKGIHACKLLTNTCVHCMYIHI